MGIWTAFWGCLVKDGCVPSINARGGGKAKAKVKGGLSLGPGEALKAVKLVHRGPPRSMRMSMLEKPCLSAGPDPELLAKRETSPPPYSPNGMDVDALLPTALALVSSISSPDAVLTSLSLSEMPPPAPTPTVKLELESELSDSLAEGLDSFAQQDDLALADDDTKPSRVTETLFFVMPNTSGLVAGCKVSISILSFVFLFALLTSSTYTFVAQIRVRMGYSQRSTQSLSRRSSSASWRSERDC